MRLIVRIEYKGWEFRGDYVNGKECFICNATPAKVTQISSGERRNPLTTRPCPLQRPRSQQIGFDRSLLLSANVFPAESPGEE
jgi:hypothetical protein